MIFGTKTFYFVPFKQLEMRGLFSKYNNFSKLNYWDLNKEDYDIYWCTLKPGDTLCISPWWWHAVDNHGYTCAITKIYERNDIEYFNWPGHEALKIRHNLHTIVPIWFTDLWKRIF